MEIEKIIYHTTRNIHNLEDKLSIATLFIFCYQLERKAFAELLYTDNHEELIQKFNVRFSGAKIDLSIRLDDKNIRECFKRTLEEVKRKYDINGYYKALYDSDPYAVVINELVNDKRTKVSYGQI